MANVYVSSASYAAVAAWTALTAYVSTSNGGRGDYIRQLATPAVGSERVFRCTTSGTSLAAEPASWTLTKNGVTTETAGPVWTECTGQEADQVSGTWKAPHARLANAFVATWGSAGDTFYLGSNHAETQATAMTLTVPGTSTSQPKVLCVNTAGSIPPVSADLLTTATISTTGASALTLLTSASSACYFYGITFSIGSAGNSASLLSANNGISAKFAFARCAFVLNNTNAASKFNFGASGGNAQYFDLFNTTVRFGATGQSILPACSQFKWSGTSNAVAGATFPTNIFGSTGRPCMVLVQGVDLSALGSNTIVADSPTSSYKFLDCKLGSSAVLSAALGSPGGVEVLAIRCDSGANNYRHEKFLFAGSQVIETTIVRTGGATDGVTPIVWKVVTTTGSTFTAPFECLPITFWNEVVGSAITIVLEGIWGGGAVPNNDEIWMDAEYPGSTLTPQGSFQIGTKADFLAAGSALGAGTGTWGGSTTKFQLSVTFTPQMKGPVTLYVKAAKASSTFYIDPKPNGVKLRKSYVVGPGVYANEQAQISEGLHHIDGGVAA